MRAAVPDIEREGMAGAADLVNQAPGAGDVPAGAVRAGLSGRHAVTVADGGEARAAVVGAGAPVDGGGFAVQRQGAGGRAGRRR